MATSTISRQSRHFVKSVRANNSHTISIDLSDVYIGYGVEWVITGRKYQQNKVYGAIGVAGGSGGYSDAIVLSSANLGTVTASLSDSVLTVSWTGDDVSYVELSVLFNA